MDYAIESEQRDHGCKKSYHCREPGCGPSTVVCEGQESLGWCCPRGENPQWDDDRKEAEKMHRTDDDLYDGQDLGANGVEGHAEYCHCPDE